MTLAVNTTRHGNAFQARVFWTYAARLLDPSSNVQRVGFEGGPRGFDDVWVEYAHNKGPQNQFGHRLHVERYQCKWHASNGTYTHINLTEPSYSGAEKVSLLQRAHDAHRCDVGAGQVSRVKLMTNHRLDSADVLYELVRTQDHTLRLDDFFAGTTRRSKAFLARELWKQHLAIDDAELKGLAAALALATVSESLDEVRRQMDLAFRAYGIRPSDPGSATTQYDDLPYIWLGQGRNEFDGKSFREACDQEGLLAPGAPPPHISIFGVKSFEHSFDRLEARCDDVLDLVPSFDGRYIRSGVSWETDLLPRLSGLIESAAQTGPRLRLAMDAHTTLAFAAGTILDTKSGRVVELQQRTRSGMQVWSADDAQTDATWPDWRFDEHDLQREGRDIAVAVSVSRPVQADVRRYLQGASDVGLLVCADLGGGAAQTAVLNGAHADALAERLANYIKDFRAKASGPTSPQVHLFISAPYTFSFFLGRHAKLLKPVVLYEFDFDGDRSGSYEPSLTMVSRQVSAPAA
ncbi:hypothetical protein C1M51_08980 [Methylibium sp. Pch-M]|uniref:SAVED domain-containing protein n=1 Tax=Methylibium sp. Pch-M TaxID=2082386 RepID=UPI001011A0EC|nr:SAVED domain-containing protein [Methylibium sp. Pch-M]QAZ39558.1 hypothetical protein C1M51_08980 [Methylibium sp. Pch-M]